MSIPQRRLFTWIIIASLFSGLLAGGNIYRYLLEVPAWKHLTIADWAIYSRHADLSNGLFLFPLEAIGSTVPLVIAAVIIIRNRPLVNPVAWPVYSATLLALAGIVLTLFAAPQMLRLQKTSIDPAIIQEIFDRFHYWGSWRAIAQVFSFVACIWAISKMPLLKPDSINT
jgi:hypothetical protein